MAASPLASPPHPLHPSPIALIALWRVYGDIAILDLNQNGFVGGADPLDVMSRHAGDADALLPIERRVDDLGEIADPGQDRVVVRDGLKKECRQEKHLPSGPPIMGGAI